MSREATTGLGKLQSKWFSHLDNAVNTIMPKTRRLLRREITYSDAKEEEFNILHQLGYYEQQVRFFDHLDAKKAVGLKPLLLITWDFPPQVAMWQRQKTGIMGVLMYAFQSPLTAGMENVSLSDSRFHIVLARLSGLGMGMRRFDVRLGPTHGCKAIAR